MWTFNRFDDFLMTVSASLFSDLAASWCDLDVVVEPTSGEIVRMPKTILCFGCVFADEVRRGVAIVTDGYCSMARLQPPTILLLHDMAIDASFCVIRHVGVAASVNESIRSDTHGQAEGDAKDKPLRQAKIHHVSFEQGVPQNSLPAGIESQTQASRRLLFWTRRSIACLGARKSRYRIPERHFRSLPVTIGVPSVLLHSKNDPSYITTL